MISTNIQQWKKVQITMSSYISSCLQCPSLLLLPMYQYCPQCPELFSSLAWEDCFILSYSFSKHAWKIPTHLSQIQQVSHQFQPFMTFFLTCPYAFRELALILLGLLYTQFYHIVFMCICSLECVITEYKDMSLLPQHL